MWTVPLSPLAGTRSAVSSRPGLLCVKFRAGFRKDELEEVTVVLAKPSAGPLCDSAATGDSLQISLWILTLTHAYYRHRYKGTISGLTAQIQPTLWGRGPEGRAFCHVMHVENTEAERMTAWPGSARFKQTRRAPREQALRLRQPSVLAQPEAKNGSALNLALLSVASGSRRSRTAGTAAHPLGLVERDLLSGFMLAPGLSCQETSV